MEQRSPGRPGVLRGGTVRPRRRQRGRAQVRADDRLVEQLRSGSLDQCERLSDRVTNALVRWRRDVLES